MNGNVVYDSTKIYLESCTTTKSKIIAIEKVIQALLSLALEAAETDNIKEYTLDSGQTKVKTEYTGADHIYKSIQDYERLKTFYQNRLNGRRFKLVNWKSFRR